jgi:hypothetical protein
VGGVVTDDDDDDNEDDDDSAPQPQISEPTYKEVNVFQKNGYQGNDWVKGQVTIPPQDDIFRVIR